VLHNNAATNRLSSTRDTDVEHMDIQVWDALMQIKLRGTMLAIKHAIPMMRRRGGGSIINTSSASSLSGAASFSVYAVSRAGINVLTEYVAVQHGKEGICCKAICPGQIIRADGGGSAVQPFNADMVDFMKQSAGDAGGH